MFSTAEALGRRESDVRKTYGELLSASSIKLIPLSDSMTCAFLLEIVWRRCKPIARVNTV